MEAAASALVIFMAFLCVGNYSQAQGQKTVLRVSFNQSSSSGLRANESTILVSSNGTFCAGFYKVSAKGYALAVWYANDSTRTLAWMANQSSVVGINSSLILRDKSLSILDDEGQIAWKSNVSRADSRRSMDLILRESGNLVLMADTDDLWESFKQFPTFTLLPQQNVSGQESLILQVFNGTYENDNFYCLRHMGDKLSLYYVKEGEAIQSDGFYWQTGNFPAVTLDDNGFLNTSAIDKDSLIMASDRGEGPLRRLTLDTDGNLRMYSRSRNSPSSSWAIVWEAVPERCKIHGTCGENALCKVDENWNPKCECPPGFKQNSTDNRSCVSLNEKKNFIFITLDYVYFDGPNKRDSQFRKIDDCIHICTNNSSCLGFAQMLDNGHCVFQFDRLLNGYWSPDKHSRMYLKVPASQRGNPNPYHGMFLLVQNACSSLLKLPFPPKDSHHTKRDLAIICTLFGAELLCGVLAFWAFLRKYSKFRDIARIFALNLLPSGGPKKFTYAELKSATKNFKDVLGRGGFGPVYRGLLPDQRQIAVKKLEGLHQGEQQFWAEITIIGRIHHLNLVRMWGFCSEGDNKLLVYEFIPNGSLDRHLFNTEEPLEWGIRYRIALGVARAIAYLHEECLEWVLHCDIKPENILLDENFCPKVSDFGLAKLVEKERGLEMSTVRGTRGYLAPEWYDVDPITAKADVYSFGMVLLEMVSGKRNFGVSTSLEEEWYFPARAFQMVVVERRAAEVVDERLRGVREKRRQVEAVERVVKTALWCIQARAEERPSMGRVAKMLEGSVEIQDPPISSSFMDIDSATPSAYSAMMSITTSALSPH